MEIRSRRLRGFVRGDISWDKKNASQLASLARCVRKRDVPLVDGIESAAKKADVHSGKSNRLERLRLADYVCQSYSTVTFRYKVSFCDVCDNLCRV